MKTCFNTSLILILGLVFYSCKAEKTNKISDHDSIDTSSLRVTKTDTINYKPSNIVFAFDSHIDLEKDNFYCSTQPISLLKLEKELQAQFDDTIITKNLTRKGYQSSLKENEYQINYNKEDGEVRINTKLDNKINFIYPYEKGRRLKFKGVPTPCFNASYGRKAIVKHYFDDKNFSISISNQNDTYEIILIKNGKSNQSFEEVWLDYSKSATNSRLFRDEEVLIPNINLNIINEYDKKDPISFFSNLTKTPWNIDSLTHKISFKLNRFGAELQSDVEIYAVEAAASSEGRKLHFDNTFFIFLKRKDSKEPYFAAYIYSQKFIDRNFNL